MTASEADAGEALWRRLTVPEKERRKLLDTYRDAVLHTGAAKVEARGAALFNNHTISMEKWRGYREAVDVLLDSQACDCGESTCPCGCQTGDGPKHWIHSRTCNTQRRP